jgi:sugar phosphate isomerase/epimerase
MSRTVKPGLQLHSVRGASEPLPDVIRRVGDAGYAGVEFADRFRNADPAAVADALDEAGVEPIAAHAALDDVEAAVEGRNDLLDRCETVGCDRVVVPRVSERQVRSRGAVRSLSYRLADVAHELDARGVDFGYHNSRYDLYPFLPDGVDALLGKTPAPDAAVAEGLRLLSRAWPRDPKAIPSNAGLWNLYARTTPDDLFFEIDTGEVVAGGFDPASVLDLFAGRVTTVHLVDVAPTGDRGAFEAAPHGEGVVDFDAVVDAARETGVEWVVVEDELDRAPESKISHGAALLDRLLDGGAGGRDASSGPLVRDD